VKQIPTRIAYIESPCGRIVDGRAFVESVAVSRCGIRSHIFRAAECTCRRWRLQSKGELYGVT
jgi:hypothetical protein